MNSFNKLLTLIPKISFSKGVNALSVPSALAMFDASGKIPDGLSTGNTYVLGSYEACVKVSKGE